MKERYHITGMTCSACSSHVEKSVNKLAGVEKASVNLLTETMEVAYDGAKLTSEEICRAVEHAGYGAVLLGGGGTGAEPGEAVGKPSGEGRRQQGRDAMADKAKAEDRSMKWRLGISLAFLLPLMYVAMFHMYRDWFGIPVPDVVMRAFHGNGNAMTFALTQFLLLLPILYMNRKFFAVGFKTLGHFSPNMDSLIAVGAGAAVGYGIFAMYRISYGMGHGDMALVEHYSHDLYFESAGMILTLITVGKYLEGRSKRKTGDAITKLMDLSPKVAVVVDEEGREREVPTEELRTGDVFLVKPGCLVPADGTILEGRSSLDEAAITGESVPVEKHEGDKVVSATLNKAGFLKCRADRVGEDTTLSQIIRLVEEAGGSKAPIARLADQVAGVFVPVVMGISLITLLGWLLAGGSAEFAISAAIAVLVISCPCALGLATPVAIMVGTGVGAGHGILIKSGEALQQAKEIDTVVLDKTGTITEGKLQVTDISCYVRGMSLETLMAAAAAVERGSEHPLAEAVVKEAESRGCPRVPVGDFQAVFGRGIQGVLEQEICIGPQRAQSGDGPTATLGDPAKAFTEGIRAGSRIYVGNRAYLEEKGVVLEDAPLKALDRIADQGQTPLLVADQGRLLGIIAVADRVKPSSLEAIRAWKKMGVKVVMLTGDNKRTAEAVRKRMDLGEVVAEVLPQDKERYVTARQREGHKVAMIGDGINDAPALAAADVGMAIGAGTDVAIESADIVLIKNDLRDAVTAMRLSRAVIRNIRQNLFWAFFYNSIGIPLAAGLLYPAFQIRLTPMFGAAAMSMSSIFVVCNALRLRGFRSGFGKGAQEPGASGTAAPKAMPETGVGDKAPDGGREKSEKEREEKTMTKVITIEGMMCAHCTGRVQKALEALEGVNAVTMSLEDKTASVELAGEVADETLTQAVADAGYEVTGIAAQ